MLVSVVLPVYNGERYLREALDSILQQTWPTFELIVVNDGSTDETSAILTSFAACNSAIRIITQANQGIAVALNAGIMAASGTYIARMDADDISLPSRLVEQVEFMEAHPDVGICGTWVETIGDAAGLIWRYPTDDATIRCQLLFECVLAHPTVMIRRNVLTSYQISYDPTYPPYEDYELWVRASRYCQLANVPRPLLFYRTHPAQITRQQNSNLSPASRVWLDQLSRLGIQPTPEELTLHQSLSQWQFSISKNLLDDSSRWLWKLHTANRNQHIYPEPAFSRVLGNRWFDVCRAATGMGAWSWLRFWRSPLSWYARPGKNLLLRFTRNTLWKH